nr:hypothetical protein [Tanacetum cinerariifolium]
MSAMTNTTPIVTTVTKTITKEKTTNGMEAASRVNILDFCEEHYEDILLIMDKIRRDKRKEVYTRLDFGENSKKSQRMREDSQNSSAKTLSARYRNPSERPQIRDRLRNNDENVFGREYSRDDSYSRGRPHKRDSSPSRDRPRSKDRSYGIEESYGNTYPSYRIGDKHRHHSHGTWRSSSMKRGRNSESPLSRVSKSGTNTGGHWQSKSKRRKPTDEEDLAVPWSYEAVDPFTPRIRNFKSSRKTRMPNNVKTYDGTGDPEDHVKIFQAATQVERWAMPTWCHMFNSTIIGTARDEETIEDFMERFKVETGCIKGASECMRISEFMHGLNNPELTKCLNEHVSKTVKEMMTATMAFIRGETAATSKKKVHTPWKSQDQSKRKNSERRSDFRNQPNDGRGHNKFTPLTKTPKEIFAAESGKFKPPPPIVTPLRKQIEELVRAGKLSHFIKEIRRDRDQQKTGKKDDPVKDKAAAIYMIYPLQRVTRQKVTQSFAQVKEITFPPLTANKGTGGPLVIEAEISGHDVHRIYVDEGSSMELRLLVTIGDAEHYTRAWMNFMIVRSPSPYNGIIGRTGIKEIQAVPSTAHEMLKFLVNGGIVTICSTIPTPTECTTITATPKDHAKKAEACHENFKVALHPDFSDQEITIGGTVSTIRTKLCTLLKRNLDIFAGSCQTWQEYHDRLPSIDSIFEKYILLLDIKTGAGLETRQGNPSRDLNKACLQDCYPLSEIDWKVESLCGYPFKCLLDAYKGYHQIQMVEQDEEKMDFHTSHGVYCHTKMPFGLKNAGATYQRLVDKAFDKQIGRNLEIYIDDLVIKSHMETEAAEGMFLGYMINSKGIKLCPDKTEAMLQLSSPRTIKEVQSLNGKLASLNRIIFKSAEKSLPFFKTLKKCIKKVTSFGRQMQNSPDTGLFCEPSAAGSRAKLYLNGKASIGASLHSQKVTQILPGASHRGHHRPAHQASDITSRRGRAIAKIERHARGAQYHIPTVDICERPDPSRLPRAGLILTSPEGMEFTYALRFQFTAFNNKAEYEALIAGLRIAVQMGVRNVHVRVYSKLVANQVLWTYVAKEENMVKSWSKYLKRNPYIQEEEVAIVVEEDGPTWMTPIMKYLKDRTLSGDKKEASKLRIKARQYELLEGVLYRRSFLKSWLRCVGPLQADYVIREIHEGSCSMHTGPQFVVAKAMRLRYYWPTMHRDARDMIRTCNACQIEAKAMATITGNQVKKFVWDNIVCRFGLPREIVSDNGKQFSDNPFKDWCEKLNITQRFASVKHSQSNGLIERANRSLGEGIKARLSEGNTNWIEELPRVLWTHRTMINSCHGDTPFSLTYGTGPSYPRKSECQLMLFKSIRVSTSLPESFLRSRLHWGPDETEANAPPKVLRKDHVASHLSQSTLKGKSLAAMGIGTGSTVSAPATQETPVHAEGPPSAPEQDIAQSSRNAVVTEDPDSEKSDSFTSMDMMDHIVPPGYFSELRHLPNDEFLNQYNTTMARQVAMGSQLREKHIKNLKALLEAEADMKDIVEAKNVELVKELESLRAQVTGEERIKAAFEEFKKYENDRELYPRMLTAIAGRRWVIGNGLRLAIMKCVESTELRHVFADVVSAGIAKGMSEGLKHGVKHGKDKVDLAAIEAYDHEADTKYVAALHALKDLKYPLDQRSLGLRTSGYTGIFSWEELGRSSWIHCGASSPELLSKYKDDMITSMGASFNFSS